MTRRAKILLCLRLLFESLEIFISSALSVCLKCGKDFLSIWLNFKAHTQSFHDHFFGDLFSYEFGVHI